MNFCARFTESMLNDCFAYQAGNIDHLRFGHCVDEQARDEVRDLEYARLAQIGLVRRHFDVGAASRELGSIYRDLARYETLYARLADEPSRANLVEVLAYRALGPRHARVGLNNPDYWQVREDVAQLRVDGDVLQAGKFELHPFALQLAADIVALHAHPLGILNTFILEQYRYRNGAFDLGVSSGDVVIDAGACWGDTTLYFAHHVGPGGHVHAFECLHENLQIYHANLRANPAMAERITLDERALWSHSGEALNFVANGPGSRICANAATDTRAIDTVSLDDYVHGAGIDRVDLIKMDIEGAELAALSGAECVMRRDRPKLALSVYHKPEDILEIPRFIENLDLGYRFFLDHFTIHNEETVLFALADDGGRADAGSALPGFSGC